ncbi:Putative uncharacterized protein [Escherichia coli D6-117.29]|nr:Putative uncharacterized protein [Escherichia coli D6-117.29]
MDIIGGQHLR